MYYKINIYNNIKELFSEFIDRNDNLNVYGPIV